MTATDQGRMRSCWRHGGDTPPFLDLCHVLLDLAHFLAMWCGCRLWSIVADGAEAGLVGSALASFGAHKSSSPVQTVQFGKLYYADGWKARGWYHAATSGTMFWLDRPLISTPLRLRDPAPSFTMGVVVFPSPGAEPRLPRLEPPRLLVPAALRRFILSAAAPGLPALWRRRCSTPSPDFRAGAATVSPGFCRRGFHGGSAVAILSLSRRRRIPTSARPPPQVLPAAAVCRVWRGRKFPWRRRRSSPHRRACLPKFWASGRSMPAAASMGYGGVEGSTSARSPRQVFKRGFHGVGGADFQGGGAAS